MQISKKLTAVLISTICFLTSTAYAEQYNVFFTNGSVSGSSSVNAESFSDAKAIYESKNPKHVVYQVERYSGEPRKVEYMSYSDATELGRIKNQ